MTPDITADLVNSVREIAHRAGIRIMEIYNSDFAVKAKEDRSPVTAADEAGEAIIIDGLLNEVQTPFPIVAEESVAAGRIPDVGGTPFWLVDPLDGTKEFIKRNGEFTVNIALIADGQPVLGVVYAPAIGSAFWGSPLGAFAETATETVRPITTREAPEDGITVVASRSHAGPETDEFLAKFKVAQRTSAGSSLKLCLVATGQADLYPRMGPTMEWDTAAGHAVVRFAGGRVTTPEGEPLVYGKADFRNPYFIVWGR